MKKAICIALVAVLLGSLLLTLALPDAKVSALENRVLQQLPKFSLSAVASGEWMADMESWLADQFPGRTFFVRAKATLEYLLGKRVLGNAYLGSDGQYFEAPVQINQSRWQSNIAQLHSFAAQHDFYFLPVYSAASLYPERLPAQVQPLDERALLAELALPGNVTVIDPYDALYAAKDTSIYFRTDHHWTQAGAYQAYRAYCEVLGLDPVTEYETIQSEQLFYGSLYSKAPLFGAQGDEMTLYDINRTVSVVYDREETTRTDSLYTLSALQEKDQYVAFLDGNHARVDIETDAGTGKTLIVLKDSFAHALVPFFANHYDTIVMLDLRYYNYPLSETLAEHSDADLLITYNVSWLAQDKNLSKLNR